MRYVLHGLGELASGATVGDGAARAADRLRAGVVRQAELVDQALQARSPPPADSDPRAGCFRSAPAPARCCPATLLTSAGTSASPARCAARQRARRRRSRTGRRSTGRTRIGCITPCSRIDSASSSSAVVVHPRSRLILARANAVDRDRLQRVASPLPRLPPASSASRPRPSPLGRIIGACRRQPRLRSAAAACASIRRSISPASAR